MTLKKNTLSCICEHMFRERTDEPEYNFLVYILQQVKESLLIIDTNSTILFVNDSYLEMFHISRSRITGKQLKQFEPLARIHEVIETGHPITSDISHIYSSGKDVYADITPLFSGDKLVGAMALMRDVTELYQQAKEIEYLKTLAHTLKDELNSKSDLPPAFQNIIGQDRTFVNMLRTAARAARSNASICITGESGTGKEVLAEAIHNSSQHSKGPLVKINCAAIPETLLESELFGYESGAFTGARSGGKPGKFELANHGTIFLDEISELPLAMQAKLLRVLQEHQIERVGGERSIDLDFRLITATNRNLEEMVKQKLFREDLYYRINVISLNIPPLRDRSSDIERFAQFFLDDLSRKYHRDFRFTRQAIFTLVNYSWPGNVREMKNYVERAAILSYDDIIDVEQLPEKMKHLPANTDTVVSQTRSFQLHEILENTERETIINTLKICNGNKTQAIELLGISRRCFYQKLNKYHLLEKE